MDEAKIKQLKEHGHYYSTPRGVSMLPMLKNGESIVDIIPCSGKLKKYDVALYYRKKTDTYILHRVIAVKPNYYIFYGDNCFTKEIVQFKDVIGVAKQFKRTANSDWVSVQNKFYKFYVHLWCDFLPIRCRLLKIYNKFSKSDKNMENTTELNNPSINTLKNTPQMRKASYDMLYLSSCAINHVTPDISRVKNIDLKNLYTMSSYHCLVNIVYNALETAYKKNLPDNEILKKMREVKEKYILRNILFDNERKEIFSWCEANKIWHLPLKGIILKEFYPEPLVRFMGDNDILYDETAKNEVKSWFKSKKYNMICGEDTSCHDSYYKEPFFHFEMHTKLIDLHFNPIYTNYYKNVKEKLISDNNSKYSYHFSNEDFYIFFIVHTFKHYISGGTGLRTLLDYYVFYNATKKHLDFKYIEKELKTLKIYDFEQQIKNLTLKVLDSPNDFDVNKLSKNEQKELNYILFSGIYGNRKNLRKNLLKNRAKINLELLHLDRKNLSLNQKIKYITDKLFPPANFMDKWCTIHAPFFLEHKQLMPLAHLWRILNKDITNFDWLYELKIAFKK